MSSSSVCNLTETSTKEQDKPGDSIKTYLLRSRAGRPSYRAWLKERALIKLTDTRKQRKRPKSKAAKPNPPPKKGQKTQRKRATTDTSTSSSFPKRKRGRSKPTKKEADPARADDKSENDPQEQKGKRLWCICQQPWGFRFMVACDRCEEWYHGDCVGIDENDSNLRDVKFICHKCSSEQPSSDCNLQRVKSDAFNDPWVDSSDAVSQPGPQPEPQRPDERKFSGAERMIVLVSPHEIDECLKDDCSKPPKVPRSQAADKVEQTEEPIDHKTFRVVLRNKTNGKRRIVQRACARALKHFLSRHPDYEVVDYNWTRDDGDSSPSEMTFQADDELTVSEPHESMSVDVGDASEAQVAEEIPSDDKISTDQILTVKNQDHLETAETEPRETVPSMKTISCTSEDAANSCPTSENDACLPETEPVDIKEKVDEPSENDTKSGEKDGDLPDGVPVKTNSEVSQDSQTANAKGPVENENVAADRIRMKKTFKNEGHPAVIRMDAMPTKQQRSQRYPPPANNRSCAPRMPMNSTGYRPRRQMPLSRCPQFALRGSNFPTTRLPPMNFRMPWTPRQPGRYTQMQQSRNVLPPLLAHRPALPLKQSNFSFPVQTTQSAEDDKAHLNDVHDNNKEQNEKAAMSTNCVWKGLLHCKEVPTFSCTAFLLLGDFNAIQDAFPRKIQPSGRLSRQAAWDYVSKIEKSPQRGYTLIYFLPASYEEKLTYAALFRQLYIDKRGVILKLERSRIRDIYIIPLGSAESLPDFVVTAGAKRLSAGHPDLLVGAIVYNQGRVSERTGRLTTTNQETFVTVFSRPSRDPRLKKDNSKQNKETEVGTVDGICGPQSSFSDKIIAELESVLKDSCSLQTDKFADLIAQYLQGLQTDDARRHVAEMLSRFLDENKTDSSVGPLTGSNLSDSDVRFRSNGNDAIQASVGRPYVESNNLPKTAIRSGEASGPFLPSSGDSKSAEMPAFGNNYEVISMDLEDSSSSGSRSPAVKVNTKDVDLRLDRRTSDTYSGSSDERK